jgi:hypothetical protein
LLSSTGKDYIRLETHELGRVGVRVLDIAATDLRASAMHRYRVIGYDAKGERLFTLRRMRAR